MILSILSTRLYFNPRSHERSDLITRFSFVSITHFNPRSHERSDSFRLRTGTATSKISIHAPTRGATLCGYAAKGSSQISIHAPTRGATWPDIAFLTSFRFQSTLPREERRWCYRRQARPQRNFNPRSHERSDDVCNYDVPCRDCISIHAPTRGATAILHKKFVYFYTIPTINI